MNKPITLCDRCEKAVGCLLNFDGILCRKNRTVEPTNADRIRSMTDEELAKMLWDEEPWCTAERKCVPSCKDCLAAWLKEEVDNGN